MSRDITGDRASPRAYYTETESQLDQIWVELLRLRDTIRERHKKPKLQADELNLFSAGQLVSTELRIVQVEERVSHMKGTWRQALSSTDTVSHERLTVDNTLEKLVLRWGSLAYVVYVLDRFQERLHMVENTMAQMKGNMELLEQEEREVAT